jgi:hypothetical protein
LVVDVEGVEGGIGGMLLSVGEGFGGGVTTDAYDIVTN